MGGELLGCPYANLRDRSVVEVEGVGAVLRLALKNVMAVEGNVKCFS